MIDGKIQYIQQKLINYIQTFLSNMKSIALQLLTIILCFHISSQAIINRIKNPYVSIINLRPSKYLTLYYDRFEHVHDYEPARPLQCALGTQLSSQTYENDFYSTEQKKLVVDQAEIKADCVGVIKFPDSTQTFQHWFLFTPGNKNILKYYADNPRWQLTMEQIMERYARTGRLTEAETNNTSPIDKIISDSKGRKYRVEEIFWSQKVQMKTQFVENYFLRIRVSKVSVF